LMAAGSRGSDVVLVLAGEAVCELGGKTVARFETGDFFGEVAVLDGQPRTATVRALTDMDVLVLSPAEFHEMVGLSPQVAHRVLRAMANRLRQANSLALAAS
ncbi:MAG TPA: Crp/Fnr family transcriptional regulator, partial [Acidimicrobiales bacterium]|nr:Crp/Fnr family transcriptional regulator [Acidimicrobiales bacterium]